MTDRPATAALRAALAAVGAQLRFLSQQHRALLLRDAVTAAVDELRIGGQSSERVVFLMQRMAVEAGVDEARDAEVLDQIESWCVQRYFAR